MPRAARYLVLTPLLALLLPALGGCTVLAVTGAVVGAGVTVASTAVGAGVAVGKGAAHVATAPFRDDEDAKADKEKDK
jgi:F0F1-type ATP synthase membrane subunit c/vacuolar-type H+-ATPase subunit K